MDALARLLGEGRKPAGDGLWLHKSNAGAYMRAYARRKTASPEQDENLLFLAELMAGSLRDDAGALLLKDGDDALERLPVAFLLEHSDALFEVNAIPVGDEDEDASLEGKSEATP